MEAPGQRLRALREARNQGSFGSSPVPYSDSDDSDDDDDEDDGKLVPFEKAIMALFFAGFFMVILMAAGLAKVCIFTRVCGHELSCNLLV